MIGYFLKNAKHVTKKCHLEMMWQPKIFTDITMPAKQSYGPNTGKITCNFWSESRTTIYGIYFIFSGWGILIESRTVFLIWLLNTIKEVCTPSQFKNHASIIKPQTLPYRSVYDIVRVISRICTFKSIFHIFLRKTNI